ncbi:MAG: hypothetical protein D0528_05485 [Methylococcales bacterium]|nr:MAG: hypothetical protein D0528_05485 [Methylococcales bacterium]
MTSHKETITIDLVTSTSDKVQFDEDQLIQKVAFDTILTRITEEIRAAKDSENNSRGMVYFIDGTRGAGKSTFLRYVTKELTPKDQKDTKLKDTKLKDIKLELLIELDPTKIETGEHVFVSLLYKLNALIEKQRNCHCSTADDFKYEAYRKQFKKLAGGLQLLDERTNPLQEIDSEAFLDWGLERVESGIAFADEFKSLIKDICVLLNKDALVISIDDADTNFSKGKQILEMIRRYLDSPHLLILITGDLQLYSHLVRDFYYESLGANIFKRDKHRKEEQIKLIDHLETQYLNKLFPLHHRTHLTSLWDLRLKTDYSVKFEYGQEPLDVIIERLLKQGMYIKSDRERDLNLYKEFLLKQSLRSIIQLLQFCTQGMEESAETKTKTKTKTKIFTPKRVAEGFRAVFRGSLHTHQVDVNTLSSGDINTLNDAVFRVVLEDGEFDTGCYLRPQPSKKSLRNCFVALAAEVARHCEKRPDYAIDYILQGLGSITLYDLISETSWTKLTDEQKQQQFRSYFSIGRNENSLNWARHASAVLAGNDAVSSGVIRIPPFIRIGNSNTVDDVPVFFLSRVNITDGNNTKTYASIFNILGIVVQFLSLTESSSQKKDSVLSELVHYSIPLTVSEPPWKEDTKEEEKENEQSWDQSSIKSYQFDSLANKIIEWLAFTKDLNNHIKPSAVFLGKVWTRLYFSLLNASIHIQTKHVGIASIMELYALCVINAFLVEESSYHYTNTDSQPFDSTNPINIDDNTLISKLNSINKFKIEQFPLTSIIMTCPLILGLIHDNKAIQLLSKISDHKFDQNLGCNIKIFSNLDAYENRYFLKKQNNRIITKKKFNSND